MQAPAKAFCGLDVLIANVGGYVDATLGRTTRAAFEASLSQNVASAFMTVQSALPHLDPLGMPDGPSRYSYAINSPQMCGDPQERAKTAVLDDLKNGYVTAERAEQVYGFKP